MTDHELRQHNRAELHALLSQTQWRADELRRMLIISARDRGLHPACETSSTDGELAAMLAEYASLRQESTQTLVVRSQILLLALPALAAIYYAGATVSDPPSKFALVVLLFSFAAPLVSLTALVLWIGEAMRVKRVNDYLAGVVEASINRKIGRGTMLWESFLKAGVLPRDGNIGPSVYLLFVFGSAAVFSPVTGVILLKERVCTPCLGVPVWELWVPWGLVSLTGAGVLYFRRRVVGDTLVRERPWEEPLHTLKSRKADPS